MRQKEKKINRSKTNLRRLIKSYKKKIIWKNTVSDIFTLSDPAHYQNKKKKPKPKNFCIMDIINIFSTSACLLN